MQQQAQAEIPSTRAKPKRFPSIWDMNEEIEIPKYHELMCVFGHILRGGAMIEQGQA